MANIYTRYPSSASGGIPIYPDLASFPVSASVGDLGVAADSGILYEWRGSSWEPLAAPDSPFTIGTFDSGTPSADGAHIDSNELIMQSASATVPGLVNTTTQTLAGDKTFTGAISASNLSGTNTGDVTLGTANGLSLLGQALSLGLSSTSTTGALSSTDWNTFNNKQDAGNYITDLTGDGTASGPGSAALTLATVNSNVGSFTLANVTVNAKGLVTAASSTSVGNLTAAGTDGIAVTGGTGSVIGAGTSIAQQVADATHNGYLSSTDWTTFNSKQAAGNYITDLTGDATATGPGSAALTLATVNSNVGSFTLSNVTVNAKGLVTAASSTSTGNLTAAGTDGISVTSGTGAVIGSGTSIAQQVSDSTHNGYLSSTDWNTFNNKQAAGNYITDLTGDATASGPGSAALTLATVNSNVGSFGSASSVSAITVNAKGLVTAAASTSIQIAESQVTNLVSDLAGKQPTGNYITDLTGDVTASGPGSASATLATVNSNVGSFTNANITVNAKGLITAASNGSAATPSYLSPTVRKFTSGSGTYDLMYAFTISSGSATVGATYTNNSVTFTVYATVSSATLVYMSGSGAPTSSGTLTKASGTGDSTLTFSAYKTPSYLKVTAVGAGGGGGGSSTVAAENGGSGGNGASTTWDTTVIVASGGSGATGGGNQLGGAGGSIAISSPAIAILDISGGKGGPTGSYNASSPNNYGTGGYGGSNGMSGGGAPGLINAAGLAPAANSGCGGGGAGAISSSTWYTGAGGGAGGRAQAIIPSPLSATYAYSIGSGGSAGSAGTSGSSGGAGADGLLIVEEYYQ